MKNLSYEMLITNPQICERLEMEARRERSRVVYAIVAGFFRGMFRRAPALQPKTA